MKFRKPLTLIIISSALLLAGPMAMGTVFHTQEQALKIAFPGADRIEKKTYVLSPSEAEEIERLASASLDSRLVTIHTARKGQQLLGYAHIDIHTVRTRPEAVLIVLDPEGEAVMLRVLAFQEPLEYMPTQGWYDLFAGRTRSGRIKVGYDIDAVTGATLTTRATVDAVRRMFAYYSVLIKKNSR